MHPTKKIKICERHFLSWLGTTQMIKNTCKKYQDNRSCCPFVYSAFVQKGQSQHGRQRWQEAPMDFNGNLLLTKVNGETSCWRMGMLTEHNSNCVRFHSNAVHQGYSERYSKHFLMVRKKLHMLEDSPMLHKSVTNASYTKVLQV